MKARILAFILYPFRLLNARWYARYQHNQEQVSPTECKHTKTATVWVYPHQHLMKVRCIYCKTVFKTPIPE